MYLSNFIKTFFLKIYINFCFVALLFTNIVFFATSVRNFCYWYDKEDCMGAPDDTCDLGYPFDTVSIMSYFGGYVCFLSFFIIGLFFVYYEKLLTGPNVKFLIFLYLALLLLEFFLLSNGCWVD